MYVLLTNLTALSTTPAKGRAEMSGWAGNMLVNIMGSVAKQQTNGKIKRLSAEELAELMVPATAKTPEEKEAALKRATTGLRAKVRVTRDMYRPR
jgi:hypothetical protein